MTPLACLAEQYAIQTGTHPRTTTMANIENMRRQLGLLGLGHDPRRSVASTDPEFYKWTQWIFLQIYNSWFDEEQQKARPIAELVKELEVGKRKTKDGRYYSDLTAAEQAAALDEFRLVYLSNSTVNWCPGLGTVLANEEVTAEGKSERGNFPVFRKNLSQWMMRITAYSDRLLDDLELLDWPEKVKSMQRNWIGRSRGAEVDFTAEGHKITVFTTRPDTLFGAEYVVLAPEHELVDALLSPSRMTTTSTAAGPLVTMIRRRPWRPTVSPSPQNLTWSARRTRKRPASSWAPMLLTRSTASRFRSLLLTMF